MATQPFQTDARRRGVLFTAFEPSGDDHAAVVISELRRRHPDVPVYAWGGPRMERAGAVIIEATGQNAVMGVPGIDKVVEHVRITRRVRSWLRHHPVAAHVPVDSPDANFPICSAARRLGVPVVHLVAPQLWAWREGRVRKLRRLTDLVLCVLPFEQEWFARRGVPARFVGHPLFDTALDEADLNRRAAAIGGDSPRLALMPGSRPGEIRRSWPVLLDAFRRLRADFSGMSGVVAATRVEVEHELRAAARSLGGWPNGLSVVVGDTDAVVHWCDLALVASGTVTLQVAKQLKPMVAFYCFSQAMRVPSHVLRKFVFTTELFTLPNLIAGRRVIPEFVPHFGDGEPLAVEVIRLLRQPGYAQEQVAALREIVRKFEGYSAGSHSAEAIAEVAGLAPPSPAAAPAA